MYLGTWQVDDLLTFAVNTHTPATGAATDADSPPTYRVYEDETGTAILPGNLALLDDANTVGQYSEQITLSAANGFEVGKSYTIRVAATVGGIAGAMIYTFQVEAALAPASDTATLLARVTAVLQTKAEADTAHGLLATAANLATANSGITTLLNNLTLAATDITTILGRVTGAVATAAKMLRYAQLTLRKDSAVATDLAAELGEINANTGTGTGGYLSTTDSQEASRDAISAGSASAADIAAELAAAGYTVVDTDSVSSSAVSKRRGDLWTVAFTDLGALGTWTKLWLTIKSGYSDPDSAAAVQILLTNPGAVGDGLQRLNGAAATAAHGSIVVDDSATGDMTITLAAVASAQLVPGQYYFDVQVLRSAGTTTLAEGAWTVRPDATRATS